MLSDRDVPDTVLARKNLDSLLGLGIFHPEQIFGQQFAKTAVNFPQSVRRRRAPVQTAKVNPLLNFNVSDRFFLQVAFLGLFAVVVFYARSMSIGWVSWPSMRLL